MTQRICYITRDYRDLNTAGNKAKTDIEQILAGMGAINIGLRRTVGSNAFIHFLRNLLGVVKAMFLLRRGDVLVLQYPMKKYYETVSDVAHFRGARVVTQIHDLNAFRSKRLTPEREIQRLDHSDAIIAHNATMAGWLHDHGCKAFITELGIFDYLSPRPVSSQRQAPEPGRPYSFFFIGNLSVHSNPFVYDLANGLRQSCCFLYGNHFEASRLSPDAKAEYLGYAVDYDLMRVNCGDFGLSWYGESLTEGKGKIGEYMSYNNPHKVSLYLRCHVPVILSRTAGLASFVQREGCGILVDSVADLEQRLASITPEEYERMHANAVRVSNRIASGSYFTEALKVCLTHFK